MSITHSVCVCVCVCVCVKVLISSMQGARAAVYCHVSCPAVPYFSIVALRHDITGKCTEHKMYTIFSTTFARQFF